MPPSIGVQSGATSTYIGVRGKMIVYRATYSGEPIATRNGLTLVEQETGLMLSAAWDRVQVNLHNLSINKKLLALSVFEVTEIDLLGEKRLSAVGLSGTIPVGALSIKAPRKRNELNRVVKGGSNAGT